MYKLAFGLQVLILQVVFIFTSILFLSGYVLQQQTVRSIQAVIHPPADSVAISQTLPPAHTSAFIDPSRLQGQRALRTDRVLPSRPSPVAYIQLVRTPQAVCDAIIAFAEIELQGSLAQKILLYPREWDAGTTIGKSEDKHLEISIRLIKKASLQYGVSFYPMDRLVEEATTLEAAYPLQGLLSLSKYERLLLLKPNGLVVDTKVLDTLFSTPMNTSIVMFIDTVLGVETSIATLIKPSIIAYQKAVNESQPSHNQGLGHAELLASRSIKPTGPLRHSSMLRFPSPSSSVRFDATMFWASVGYVKFSDREVLGPEYATPKAIWHRVRPEHSERRLVWESLYDKYRERRMAVCGLDLEPMPISGA